MGFYHSFISFSSKGWLFITSRDFKCVKFKPRLRVPPSWTKLSRGIPFKCQWSDQNLFKTCLPEVILSIWYKCFASMQTSLKTKSPIFLPICPQFQILLLLLRNTTAVSAFSDILFLSRSHRFELLKYFLFAETDIHWICS